jgi:ribosome-associated protein
LRLYPYYKEDANKKLGLGENKSERPASLVMGSLAKDHELLTKDPKRMTPLPIRGEHITLAQAVKAVGLADSGGQAKHLVRAGGVTVNGAAEVQPGRKLFRGDRFAVGAEGEWVIQ